MNTRQRLAAAMARVSDSSNGWAPYFGVVLRGLVRRELDPAMCAAMEAVGMRPTLAVTKDGILFWSAAFVDSSTTEDLAQGLMHETMHVLLKHHERAEVLGIVPEPTPEYGAKAMLANWAMDACVNEELRKLRQPPAEWIYPEKLEQPPGLIFEERYQLLLKEVKEQAKKRGGKGEVDVGKGWCGGCAGHPVPGEPQPGKTGADGKAEGRSEAEMARMRKETAESIKQHAETKGRGTVPDSLVRWADETLAPPKIDWKQKLAQAVRAAVAYRPGAVDLTYTKISRRQAGIGFGYGMPIVPTYHAPVPSVACGIDASGSMSSDDLTMAAVEVQGVLAAVGASVTVVACDAQVHGVKECRTIQAAVGLLKGGGGTTMTPIFDELEKRKTRPQVVIVLTDGHIGNGHPHNEPSWCRTVWIVIGENGNPNPCPWGETIHIVPGGVKESVA